MALSGRLEPTLALGCNPDMFVRSIGLNCTQDSQLDSQLVPQGTAAVAAAVAAEGPESGKGIAVADFDSTDNVNMINTLSYLCSSWILISLIISGLSGLSEWL